MMHPSASKENAILKKEVGKPFAGRAVHAEGLKKDKEPDPVLLLKERTARAKARAKPENQLIRKEAEGLLGCGDADKEMNAIKTLGKLAYLKSGQPLLDRLGEAGSWDAEMAILNALVTIADDHAGSSELAAGIGKITRFIKNCLMDSELVKAALHILLYTEKQERLLQTLEGLEQELEKLAAEARKSGPRSLSQAYKKTKAEISNLVWQIYRT